VPSIIADAVGNWRKGSYKSDMLFQPRTTLIRSSDGG
jgi:hypothetical protein